MNSSKDNAGERRKRKIVTQPVLVRSVKPGNALSASYERPQQQSFQSFWKAA